MGLFKNLKKLGGRVMQKAKDIGGQVIRNAKDFAIDTVGDIPIVGQAGAALLRGGGLSDAGKAFRQDVIEPFKDIAKGKIMKGVGGIVDDIPGSGQIISGIKRGVETGRNVMQKGVKGALRDEAKKYIPTPVKVVM